MKKSIPPQSSPAPLFQVIEAAGTSRSCGRQLGKTWGALLGRVASVRSRNPQWWRQQQFRKLVSRHIPHIPDLYEGMAQGAKIDPKKLVIPTPKDVFAGCTSFAVDASATRNGRLLCGQTKDTPINRMGRYEVLKLTPTDAPASLTLTYAGMLYGHGFVAGGCAVFRNSLHAGKQEGKLLPYDVWGLLSLHCKSIAEVIALLEEFGVNEPFHCTVCDASGSIAGIENGTGGVAVLRAKAGIYTHANNVLSGDALKRYELVDRNYVRFSGRRTSRLAEILSHNRTRLTPQLVLAALSDHQDYPRSICNHESDDFGTRAVVVAEPSTGRIWVVSGQPCENWAREYRLDR